MEFISKKLVFSFASIFIFFILFNFLFLNAPKKFPSGKIINIEQGINLRLLSKYLQDNYVIRSRVAFETFVIIYGGEKHIIPGDYLFEKKMSVSEIARRISKGKYDLAPIKVTLPEGFDVNQMAEVFSSKLVNFKKDIFLLEAQKSEGYLFPDTYFFFSVSNEKDALDSLRNNFEKKIFPFQNEIFLSGKTEKEIIVMASIIEREAKGDNDRTIISGILWKRIFKGMLLQVDAEPITYKTKGLPENPICNPGIESIKASIYPIDSLYLYYLHDKDGIVHFAKTFEEHKKNIAKYLK